MEPGTDSFSHVTTTVQKSFRNATLIDSRQEIRDIALEYGVGSGDVLISDKPVRRAPVSHISNVVLDLAVDS